MVKRLYIIYGCHGAGKTTLAKNVLQQFGEIKEYKNEYGTYTTSKNNEYVAVGQYHSKCGGADSIKTTDLYFKMIDFLFKEYPNSTVICEGIFLSGLFSKPLKHFLRYKYDKNIEITQILLYADVATSYKRVYYRNNIHPKEQNIINKQKSVTRTFLKFQELCEFNSIIINTENKTSDQVFKEFKERINNVKRG